MGIEYRPLTDSVRELNRMLMEQQAWNSEFKLQEADRGLKNMLTKSQLQTAAQQQQLAQYQIAEQERMHTPKILQMSSFPIFQQNPNLMDEFENNEQAMKQFQKTIDDDGVGYYYSQADKTWKHPISDEPARFSPYEMKFRVPGMMGIIEGAVDTVANMKTIRDDTAKQLTAIDKDIEKARKDPHTKTTDLTKLYRSKQVLIDEFKASDEFLQPKSLMEYYERKQQLMLMRGSFYHKMGAKDLANQMQRNADQAAAGKQAALEEILRRGRKGETDKGKPTGDIMVYATKEHKKGTNGLLKDYGIGDTRKIRWPAGETELQLAEGWDFNDPLTKEQREGKKPVKASFNFLQSVKKYADDVKDTSMFGQMTAPQKRLVRDAMDIAHRNRAKATGVGADADNSEVYGMVKETFAAAYDDYWLGKKQMEKWKDTDDPRLLIPLTDEEGNPLLDVQGNPRFGTLYELLKAAHQDKTDDELQEIAKEMVEQKFHGDIGLLTGGKHRLFLPSKQTRTQEIR